VLHDDEPCDDGNDSDEDECTSLCQRSDRCGGALSFDGEGALWTELPSRSAGMIEAWVSLSAYGGTIVSYGDLSGARQLWLEVAEDGSFVLKRRAVDATERSVTLSAVALNRRAPLERWFHVRLTLRGAALSDDLERYEDAGVLLEVDGQRLELAGRMTGAWGADMGVESPVLHFGARLSEPSPAEPIAGFSHYLTGKLKHMSVWDLEQLSAPRGLDASQSRDDLSPQGTSAGLLAAWTGVGDELFTATQDLRGGETGLFGLSLSETPDCVWRTYRCDDDSEALFPCPESAQLSGAVDVDEDGLDDRAELSCELELSEAPRFDDSNGDGLSDAEACLSLSPVAPMFELRRSESALYAVELWLREPIELLRPQLLELRLDYSETLRLVGHDSGEAAVVAGLNAFAADLAGKVRLTLTGYSAARAAEGHLATIYFELLEPEGGEVSFDLETWQIAPLYIDPYVTFGEGAPSRALTLP
jgi:hypothetical protein